MKIKCDKFDAYGRTVKEGRNNHDRSRRPLYR
jgi:hypothetical protein